MMKLGILGGGQLGRMLLQAAGNYTLDTFVLENDSNCPAAHLCTHFVEGDIRDYDAVYAFGKLVDVLTIEIENINIDALFQLQKEGVQVIPSPEAITIIKDKGIQKQFYADNNIPTAPFLLTKSKAEIEAHINFLPAANKLRTGGYDGKGVELLFDVNDLHRAFTAPSLLEKMVEIKKEIAVLVGVGINGDTVVYEPTEMVFDPKLNLVDYLIAPADITTEQIKTAETMALQAVNALQSPGLFAVEMFLSTDDKIVVNEIAPRAHNSGHQTIEGNLISQYDMQLRIFQQLPLGKPTNRGFSAMYNLIGEATSQGNTMYQGLEKALAIEGVFVHQYGKATTKPGRKMGHITIVDDNKESLLQKLLMVKSHIHVIGDKAVSF